MDDRYIIGSILVKCYKNEQLTDDEIKYTEMYKNITLFESLPDDLKKNVLEIIDLVENIKIEKNEKLGIKKAPVYVKKLGKWPGYRKMIHDGVW